MPAAGGSLERDVLAALAGLTVLVAVGFAGWALDPGVVPPLAFLLAPLVAAVIGPARTVVALAIPAAAGTLLLSLAVVETDQVGAALARATLCLVGGLGVALLARQRDRREAKLLRSRTLDHLRALSDRLAPALEPTEVAGVVVRDGRAVVGADRAAMYLDIDGEVADLAASDGYAPADLVGAQRISLGAPTPLSEALRHGRVLALDRRVLLSSYPALEGVSTKPSPYVALVPLEADGVALGVAVFGFDRTDPRRGDHRSLLATVGASCSQALQRARLLDQARRSAAHVAILQRVTAALAEATSVPEVGQAVLRESRRSIGSVAAAITVVGPADTTRMLLAASEGFGPSVVGQWSQFDRDAPIPVGVCLRTGEMVAFEDGPAMAAAYPALAPAVEADQVGAAVWVPIPGRRAVAGVLNYFFPRAHRLDVAERELLVAMAEQCGQALERAELLEIELAEQARWRAEAERAVQIERLNASFSAALTPDELVAAFAEQAVSALGARSGALLALEHGPSGPWLRPLGGRSASPSTGEVVAQIPPGSALVEVAASGRSCFLRDRAEIRSSYPELAGTGTDVQACAVVPVRSYTTVLGVVGLLYAEPRAFDSAEQAHLVAVGQRCGEALERSRLYVAERASRIAAERAATVLAEMQAVTAALTGAVTTKEVGPVVVSAVLGTLGAVCGGVLLADEGQLEVLSSVGMPGLADRWPLSASPDIAQAIERDEPLVVTGLDPTHPSPGQLRMAMGAGGARTLALMPLRGRDAIVGVLAVGWVDDADPSPSAMSALATFAGLCGQALERTRAFDAEHAIAATLQHSLLPALPAQVGRLELAGRYRAGTRGTQVGGDWFDAFDLGGDRVCLVIGDVEGRGVRAASTMGQLRAALRAAGATQHEPAALLHVLNATLLSGGGPMATMAIVVVDGQGGARYAYAGHPPVYLRQPDGCIRELEGGRSLPLGVMEATYRTAYAQLAPGTVLAMYTDGLVERRGQPLDDGLAQVSGAMRGSVDGLDVLASRLMGLMSEEDQTDDVAVLVARFGHLDRLRFAPLVTLNEVRHLRATLADWLREREASDDDVLAISLAVSEAAVNALQHAYPLSGGTVEVEVRCDDGLVEATITDHGQWRPPDPRRGGGRGLALVHQMTTAQVASGPAGTTVRLRRRLAEGAAT